MFRQHSDTVSHPTRTSIRSNTLFPLNTFICYLAADHHTSSWKWEFRSPPDHCYKRTCPVTRRVYVSLLVRNSQFLLGGQRTATGCMHNLIILSGHITNNRKEFWKFATNTNHEHVRPQYNHKQWNSEPNLVISSPCISGIYLWYWSISLQRMTKASLFSNWALCSYSCSRLEKMLREPLWAMDTRPAGINFSSELKFTKKLYWIKLALLNQCMPPLNLINYTYAMWHTSCHLDVQGGSTYYLPSSLQMFIINTPIFVFWFPCTCANGLSKWLVIRATLQI